MENQRFLTPPPNQSLPARNLTQARRGAITSAIRGLRHFGIRSRTLKSRLAVDVATLNAFLYRNRNQFRNDKGHASLSLVAKAAKRFLDELNLDKLCSDFASTLPLAIDVANNGNDQKELHLPSRQRCEFLLVKIHGSFLLVEKLCIYCALSADKQVMRVRLGHFWNMAMNGLAAVSGIWALSKNYLALLRAIHYVLNEMLEGLPAANSSFLETTYSIPSDLLDVLSGEYAGILRKELNKVQMREINPKVPINTEDSSLTKVLSSDALGEGVIVRRDKVNTNTPKKATEVSPPAASKPSEIVLDGSSLPCKKSHWRRLCMVVDTWQECKDVTQFAMAENKQRKVDRKGAVTKKLNQTQWKELKARLLSEGAKKKFKKKKLKTVVKAWIVYPELRGEIPEQWRQVVSALEKT